MGWFVLSIFLVIFTATGFYENHDIENQTENEISVVTNQRAIETVQYLNAINDYIYLHPEILNADGDFKLTSIQIGMEPDYSIYHIVSNKRVYVWQNSQRGLMTALKAQTMSSALLGTVVNRRLINNGGSDMDVQVPAEIPNGSIVYLN
ncbi:type IV pilus biogenesis protein PilM [Pantoea stewartii]|uniref:type IV pilus biogenesis protein PilM n=1 Tax=Pantoea stewartii TaxID=66269 RepID=UPI0025A24CE2|nr:type IV pilus biogenesis protein PilM [Pantoea stewartii]